MSQNLILVLWFSSPKPMFKAFVLHLPASCFTCSALFPGAFGLSNLDLGCKIKRDLATTSITLRQIQAMEFPGGDTKEVEVEEPYRATRNGEENYLQPNGQMSFLSQEGRAQGETYFSTPGKCFWLPALPMFPFYALLFTPYRTFASAVLARRAMPFFKPFLHDPLLICCLL